MHKQKKFLVLVKLKVITITTEKGNSQIGSEYTAVKCPQILCSWLPLQSVILQISTSLVLFRIVCL